MEVVGAVAAIYQLSQAALSLSKTLYSLGSAIGSASEDVEILAEDLKTFSQSLTLLSRLLEDSKSWYSDDIYLLTAKIIKECVTLYEKIEKILAKLSGNGKSNWKIRVKFVYKEGEIRKLLKRLRDMKGTLATILMSLQVDLQLSLLNLSSTGSVSSCNSRSASDVSLAPETLQNLREAQKSVKSGGFMAKYTSASERTVESSGECLHASATFVERSNSQQSEAQSGSVPPSFKMQEETRLKNPDLVPHQTMSVHSVPHSFMMVPSNSADMQTIFAPRTIAHADGNNQNAVPTEVDYSARQLPAESVASSSADILARTAMMPTLVESPISGKSTEVGELEMARKIKAIQSVLHAFRSALEVLDIVLERRIKNRRLHLYPITNLLKESLIEGRERIDRRNLGHFKALGNQYINAFGDKNSMEIQRFGSILMQDVGLKLHEYTAEHEELDISCFEPLSQSTDHIRQQVILYLDTVAATVLASGNSYTLPNMESNRYCHDELTPVVLQPYQPAPGWQHDQNKPDVYSRDMTISGPRKRGQTSQRCIESSDVNLASPAFTPQSPCYSPTSRFSLAEPDPQTEPSTLKLSPPHRGGMANHCDEILPPRTSGSSEGHGNLILSHGYDREGSRRPSLFEYSSHLAQSPKHSTQFAARDEDKQISNNALSENALNQALTSLPEPGSFDSKEQRRLEILAKKEKLWQLRRAREERGETHAGMTTLSDLESAQTSRPAQIHSLADTEGSFDGRHEKHVTIPPDLQTSPSNIASNPWAQPAVGSNHALQDYAMQLMLLEQQNKKRRMLAQQAINDQGSMVVETRQALSSLPSVPTAQDQYQQSQAAPFPQKLSARELYSNNQERLSKNEETADEAMTILLKLDPSRKLKSPVRTSEADKKALADYQMSLVTNMNCRSKPKRRMMYRDEGFTSDMPAPVYVGMPRSKTPPLTSRVVEYLQAQPNPPNIPVKHLTTSAETSAAGSVGVVGVIDHIEFDENKVYKASYLMRRSVTGNSSTGGPVKCRSEDETIKANALKMEAGQGQDVGTTASLQFATPREEDHVMNDVLQNFDFDSFLDQDENDTIFNFDFGHTPGEDNEPAEISWSLPEHAATVTSTTHVENEEKPQYINAKQFHRILKRRRARQEFEERNDDDEPMVSTTPSTSPPQDKRAPQGHESMLIQTSEVDSNMELNATIIVPIGWESTMYHPVPGSQRSVPTVLNSIDPYGKAIEMACSYPTLTSAQTSRLWWQTYINLISPSVSQGGVFSMLSSTLERELGLSPHQYASDEDICQRIVDIVKPLGIFGSTLHEDRPELKAVLSMRGDIVRILMRVHGRLDLKTATLGWSCVCAFLNIFNKVLNNTSPLCPSALNIIETAFSQLQEIVQIIARYAVMENLYQQSITSGTDTTLSLKPEYRSSLVSLCSSILEWFADSYIIGTMVTSVSRGDIDFEGDAVEFNEYGDEKVGNCQALMVMIREKNDGCRIFRVEVDVKDDEGSDVDDMDDENISDGSWEEIGEEDIKASVIDQ